MTDSEKAKFLLKLLSTQKLKFNGAREAFSFTQSYSWLIELTKEMEKPKVKPSKISKVEDVNNDGK